MNHLLKFPLAMLSLMILTQSCRDAGKQQKHVDQFPATPAFASVNDSILHFPENAGLYIERAQLLSRSNLHEQATADYRKAWELAPAESTVIPYASNLAIVGNTALELRLLLDAIKQFPSSADLRHMLGDVYVQAGSTKKALVVYDSLIARDSADFESWYESGMLYAQMKDTIHAIKALKQAYAIQPITTYALELAHLYAEMGNQEAVRLCDMIIAKDSARELADPFLIKGIYFANKHQYDAAILSFDSCIKRDWKFTDAYIEKGIAAFDQKNYDVAMNTFRMAATVSNTNPDAYYWIGRCYEAIGKNEDAVTYYQRAAALDRNFTEAKEAIVRLKG